jgi:hypothetical protein
MKLTSAFMANAAEQRDGLLYVLGGGWDTVNVMPGNPTVFNGSLVLRFAATRQECGRDHQVEIVCDGEDGQRVFALNVTARPEVPKDYPVAWDVSFGLVANFVQSQLPGFGLYQIAVISDNVFLGSVPLRAIPYAASS